MTTQLAIYIGWLMPHARPDRPAISAALAGVLIVLSWLYMAYGSRHRRHPVRHQAAVVAIVLACAWHLRADGACCAVRPGVHCSECVHRHPSLLRLPFPLIVLP
jgi:chromate transport protein ChrA